MKDWLLMAAVAGVGFLATLGVIALRGGFSHPAAVPPQAVAIRPVTPSPATESAMAAVNTAANPAASDPQPEGRETADQTADQSAEERADSVRAPNFDQELAARDRAAAHSARSR
jgi:hypothetical protein